MLDLAAGYKYPVSEFTASRPVFFVAEEVFGLVRARYTERCGIEVATILCFEFPELWISIVATGRHVGTVIGLIVILIILIIIIILMF